MEKWKDEKKTSPRPSPIGKEEEKCHTDKGCFYKGDILPPSLSFIIYHLAKLRFAQSHAACHTKRGCYCGQNRDDQLNNCFPSFLFHKVTYLSPRSPVEASPRPSPMGKGELSCKQFERIFFKLNN